MGRGLAARPVAPAGRSTGSIAGQGDADPVPITTDIDAPGAPAPTESRPDREPRSSAQTSDSWRAASMASSGTAKARNHCATMARYSSCVNG